MYPTHECGQTSEFQHVLTSLTVILEAGQTSTCGSRVSHLQQGSRDVTRFRVIECQQPSPHSVIIWSDPSQIDNGGVGVEYFALSTTIMFRQVNRRNAPVATVKRSRKPQRQLQLCARRDVFRLATWIDVTCCGSRATYKAT
jgi:hypothetical protein